MTQPNIEECETQLLNYIDTNWQEMEGDNLVDVDPVNWLRSLLASARKEAYKMGYIKGQLEYNQDGLYDAGRQRGAAEMLEKVEIAYSNAGIQVKGLTPSHNENFILIEIKEAPLQSVAVLDDDKFVKSLAAFRSELPHHE